MPDDDKPLKPFRVATLKELIEESRRLLAQSQKLRRKSKRLDKAIEQREAEERRREG